MPQVQHRPGTLSYPAFTNGLGTRAGDANPLTAARGKIGDVEDDVQNPLMATRQSDGEDSELVSAG